eukprot:jgi/Mesen1/6990/ME000364S06165
MAAASLHLSAGIFRDIGCLQSAAQISRVGTSLSTDQTVVALFQRSRQSARVSISGKGHCLPDSWGGERRAFAVTKSWSGVAAAGAAGSTLPDNTSRMEEKADRIANLMSVGDVMTRGALVTATLETSVDEALEALVDNRITGMPVVDDTGRLVGVVSDYDLLALDSISGKRETSQSLFPEASKTWKVLPSLQAFKEIQKLLIKTRGRTVGDVMTASPLVVRPMTNLEDAARLLLESKYRRLPVVDDVGRLVGLLTRGNVVRAALEMKRAAEARGDEY